MMRIAFIYKASNPFYSGTHFDNTYYDFFVTAMQRNADVDYRLVPISGEYDAGRLKGKCDAVILEAFRDYNIPRIRGLKALDVPVLARCGDCHDVRRYGVGEQNYDDYGIDCVFSWIDRRYFFKYYPRHMQYKTILFGVEPSLYQNLTPYGHRIRNMILNSGAVARARRNPIPSCLRYARDIFRNPEGLPLRSRLLHPKPNPYKFYRLRTDCNRLAYVRHERSDSYQQLLARYRAAIAAATYHPTIKYWEIAAAGCLTFMEITLKNRGPFGFENRRDCIAIDEDNYKERFAEYLDSHDDPIWEEIASAGRAHAMRHFNNDKGVEDLLALAKRFS